MAGNPSPASETQETFKTKVGLKFSILCRKKEALSCEQPAETSRPFPWHGEPGQHRTPLQQLALARWDVEPSLFLQGMHIQEDKPSAEGPFGRKTEEDGCGACPALLAQLLPLQIHPQLPQKPKTSHFTQKKFPFPLQREMQI